MVFNRFILAIAAQLGLFTLGVLSWLALMRGLFATAALCALGAGLLATLGLTAEAFRRVGERLPGRMAPGATFTAELSRRRLQALLDQAPSPLLLQTEDDQLIAVNRAARQLFDVAYALPVASRHAILGSSGQLPRPGETVKWKGLTFAVHQTELIEDGRVSQLAVLTDISAEVRAAEATALRDLLRVLNHELMNALTPVASMSKSALDLLRDGTPEACDAAAKALERVVARTEGLHQFINAYRALTRLPPPVIRPTGLDDWLDVLRESFIAQWSEAGVLLEIIAPEGVSVEMDEDQMWLCVGNLLNNAAQAALEREAPRVRLSIVEASATLLFAVEDSGRGIAPADADRVFLPFFTTKPTGTGVGLSLARQIVQGHGHALRVGPPFVGQSDRLPGAHFEFELQKSLSC